MEQAIHEVRCSKAPLSSNWKKRIVEDAERRGRK